MTGKDLLAGLPHQHLQGTLDFPCDSITYDSRTATPGSVFVALKGARTDGHDHVQDATQRGVSMVIVEQNIAVPNEIAVVQVPDSRQALARLASTFHRHPAQSLKLIGITGTNGKTTTAYLIHALLTAAQLRPGLVGTVRSEEHTSELQSRTNLVCRLLLEKKKKHDS